MADFLLVHRAVQYGDGCAAAAVCAFDCCLTTQTNTQVRDTSRGTDRRTVARRANVVTDASFCLDPQVGVGDFSRRGQGPGTWGEKVRGHRGPACSSAEDHPFSLRGQTSRRGRTETQVRGA